jgi:putative Mn2+ efflux pump MntP
MFGTTVEGPLAEIIVRNWGALIALIGVLLIYGAFKPTHRAVVLVIAGLSKAIFIGLVLTFGTSFLNHQVGISIAVDSVMVLLFASYLIAARRNSPAA